MNNKLVPWIGGGIAVVIVIAALWGIIEYKQEQDLTSNVQGRYEHVDRTRILTVTAKEWTMDRWDTTTSGWHRVDSGEWTVSSTGTFIFKSQLNSATYPVRLDGNTIWFNFGDEEKQVGDPYRRTK